MPVKQHPKYLAWNAALEQLVEAERRYYTAVMEDRTPEEIEPAALALDDARAKYKAAADDIG